MSSIVLELQQEVLKTDCDILNALRKAHVIASKLQLKEFDAWIIHELNGYSNLDEADIPEYRKVKGSLKARNPYQGWIPVEFDTIEIHDAVCTRYLREPISSILELHKNSKHHIQVEFSGEFSA